jgi:hypothetical protein
MQYAYTVDFPQMRMTDLAIVGSKNASLGEMFNVLKPRELTFSTDLPLQPKPIGTFSRKKNCARNSRKSS